MIPEDVIKDFILPYMVHLKQIDQVANRIQRRRKLNLEFVQDVACHGETSALLYLFHNYKLSSNIFNHAFTSACLNGRLHMVQLMVNLRKKDNINRRIINPAFHDNQPILSAANSGHLEIVRFLCELRNDDDYDKSRICDPSAQNNITIQEASRRGHVQVVRYLCELTDNDGNYICDPFHNNNYPIYLASENGHLEVVKFLCNFHRQRVKNTYGTCGSRIVNGNDFLYSSTVNGHLAVVKYLCELRDVDGKYICYPDDGIIALTYKRSIKDKLYRYLRKIRRRRDREMAINSDSEQKGE